MLGRVHYGMIRRFLTQRPFWNSFREGLTFFDQWLHPNSQVPIGGEKKKKKKSNVKDATLKKKKN